MDREEGSDRPDVLGRPVEAAVDAVLAVDDTRDRETVRATLDRVAEDGVVTESGVEAALAELSKVVSTPETRIELAAIGLSEARETAETEGVAGLDTVRSRLDAYESRLGALEEEIGVLGPELRSLVDRREDGDVYAVAAGVRDLESEANDLHRAADELGVDLESFEAWLTDPGTRYDDLEADIESVEGSLEALADAVERLASGATSGDPGVVWADATLRARVTALLVADLRAEIADLRGWPEGTAGDTDRLDDLEDRLDDLATRCRHLRGRLADLARPAWRERFGDRIDGLEAALEGFEPPVPWGEVEAELARCREGLGESYTAGQNG